jgi:hypothetical protein
MSRKQRETNVWKTLQLELSPLGFRLFRNQRYKGKTDKGIWIDCGVGGDGGADLVGYRILTITPEMVGSIVAQYVELEAKTDTGVASKEQKMRSEVLNKNGALAVIAKSVEDVKKRL